MSLVFAESRLVLGLLWTHLRHLAHIQRIWFILFSVFGELYQDFLHRIFSPSFSIESPFRAPGGRTRGRISRRYQKQSNCEKKPLRCTIQQVISASLVLLFPLGPWSLVIPNENECLGTLSVPTYTHPPAPTLHSLHPPEKPDSASPSIWFLIPSLTSCLSVESSWWCLFPSARQIYLTLPHSIEVTIALLFCATLQTPRCGGGRGRDGAGGGKGHRDMERQGGEGGQWVFVKRLSGALRILAERGPLMGDRQAQCLAGHRRLVVYRTNAADTNPAINHV